MRPIWSYRGPNPLSRFLESQAWDRHIEQVKVEIARETGHDLKPNPHAKIGDRRQLRGIPVAGAATGTMHDTDPLAALLRKEGDADRRRDR